MLRAAHDTHLDQGSFRRTTSEAVMKGRLLRGADATVKRETEE